MPVAALANSCGACPFVQPTPPLLATSVMAPSCLVGRREWGVRLKGSQQAQQSIQPDGVFRVMSESTLPTALAELGVPPAGECDKGHVPGVRQTPDLLGGIVSGPPRQAKGG